VGSLSPWDRNPIHRRQRRKGRFFCRRSDLKLHSLRYLLLKTFRITDYPARLRRNQIFLQKETKPRKGFIPTERKFKLRFPPTEFFTEGNEGNEGGSGPAKYNLCFLSYLLFKIFSDAACCGESLFTKGNQGNESFCSRCALPPVWSPV